MRKLMNKKLNKKGFTLMEMLIVVAIIAILVAIAIPTFSNALNKAKVATDEANLRAYYAEQITDYLLSEDDTPSLPATNTTAQSSVTVDGNLYNLQAGTYTIKNNGENFQIIYSITKGSDKGSTVTIPGGVKTPATP